MVAEYLTEVEEDRMGLGESAAGRERNQALAARLLTWYSQETTAGAE